MTAEETTIQKELLLHPINLRFEEGLDEDAKPKHWRGGGEGYEFSLDLEVAYEGSASGRLSSENADRQAFGAVSQTISAAQYNGKRIRLTGYLKTENVTGRGALWLRVDGSAGMLTLQNMSDRPVSGTTDWTRYELLAEVPAEAQTIRIGFLQQGAGTLWANAFSLEVIGLVGEGDRPPGQVSPNGLRNLIAFARLFGYVRFFHPSDEAATVDWNEFAMAGVEAVESAAGIDELINTLSELLLPIAPTVRVFRAGEQPELPHEISVSSYPGAPVIAWRHLGIGAITEGSIYSSIRTTGKEPTDRDFGAITQTVPASSLVGKSVSFRGSVSAHVEGKSRGGLWLRIDKEDGTTVFFENMKDSPIVEREFREYGIVAEVPEGADSFSFGVLLEGWGRVHMRSPTMAETDGQTEQKLLWPDPSAESADPIHSGWKWLEPHMERDGYRMVSTDEDAEAGSTIGLEADPMAWPPVPPSEPFVRDLVPGVTCLVPLSLYLDEEGHTLPRTTSLTPTSHRDRPEGFLPSGNDRTTRLANVILAWNVFQHFYPYFDVIDGDWNAELERALTRAAVDLSAREFLRTMRLMLAALKDGHAGVWGIAKESYRLPLLWDWVEDCLVVTKVPSGTEGIARGDVVLRINGEDAQRAIAAAEELISAATTQWRSYRALMELALREGEEPVQLEVLRDGEILVVDVTPTLSQGGTGLEEARPDKIEEVAPGIFYVDIGRVVDDDFKAALPQLSAARGIVFDLRGYPRGSVLPISHLIDQPVTCAQWNIPIVPRPDREEMDFHFSNWVVEPELPTLTKNRAFLTDGRAISYAETYLGIIEHYRLAEIVGSATAGTNGNVNPFSLPGGYEVPWTGMKVLKHDGTQHHGVGILPTIPVSRTIGGVKEGRDELLEAALLSIQSRLQPPPTDH